MADEITPDEIDRIQQKTIERIKAEAYAYPAKDPNEDKITSKFIEDCIYANELGDGILFATIHRGNYLFNNSTQNWLFWNGHTWQIDRMERVLAAVEDVVDRLLDETLEISKKIAWLLKKGETDVDDLEKKRSAIQKRIYRLRQDKGRNMCIKFARSCRAPIAIEGNELDMNPWLLGCKNGVIDLERGEFRDGKRDDFITRFSPTSWKGINYPAPCWENFLNEVLDRDKEVISYLHRLLGCAIIGEVREHVFPVFWGPGRNGKSTLIEVLEYVLGTDLAAPISPELLLAQSRFKNSSGPTPDLMGLRGLRIAFASEVDDGQKFSTARVKLLCGGDTIVGRSPHDKYETRFRPSHTIFLVSNSKPGASPMDFGFWERCSLITFKFSFVKREPIASNERPARENVLEELKKEASGILAWLVRGCLLYQKMGLSKPDKIQAATLEYRKGEDILADFLEAVCLVDSYLKVGASDLFEAFASWAKKSGEFDDISQAKFGKLMKNRFLKKKDSKGYVTYFGLGLKVTDN